MLRLTIFLAAFMISCSDSGYQEISFPNQSETEVISLQEAKTFLKKHYTEAFPGASITNETFIKISSVPGKQMICYVNECWPVLKHKDHIENLALTLASQYLPALVTFENVRDPERLKEDWWTRTFALEIIDSTHLANILRYFEGYSQFNSYHINVYLKDIETPPNGIRGFYFDQEDLQHADDLVISYQAGGKLEEIYDGQVGLTFTYGAEAILKNPFFNGRFATYSPWAVFAYTASHNDVDFSNMTDLRILPEFVAIE